MSTAREVVAQALYEVEVSGEGWANRTAADAVLAALREHWMNDPATKMRVAIELDEEDIGDLKMRAAIAALFEEGP